MVSAEEGFAVGSERKLSSRKRRFSKGKAIRVSDLIYDLLNRERRSLSWDCFLRRVFGQPDRAGNEQPLIEGVLEAVSGRFLLRLPDQSWRKLEEDAYEIAFLSAAKQRLKRVDRPIRMREIV